MQQHLNVCLLINVQYCAKIKQKHSVWQIRFQKPMKKLWNNVHVCFYTLFFHSHSLIFCLYSFFHSFLIFHALPSGVYMHSCECGTRICSTFLYFIRVGSSVVKALTFRHTVLSLWMYSRTTRSNIICGI